MLPLVVELPVRLGHGGQALDGQPVWLQDTGYLIASGAVAVLVALAIHWLFFHVLSRIARGTDSPSDDILLRRLLEPTRFGLIALALVLVAREWPVLEGIWIKVAGFVMPALIGWIAYAIMRALVEAMSLKADVTVADNLMFPTIARVGPDGMLYVANFSVGGDNGEGQILRIDTGARAAAQVPR